jgi:hypothetical protein
MVTPDSQAQRACRQAEIPLIVLYRFPGPALNPDMALAKFFLSSSLNRLLGKTVEERL